MLYRSVGTSKNLWGACSNPILFQGEGFIYTLTKSGGVNCTPPFFRRPWFLIIRQGKGQMKCCYPLILTFVQNRYHKSQQKKRKFDALIPPISKNWYLAEVLHKIAKQYVPLNAYYKHYKQDTYSLEVLKGQWMKFIHTVFSLYICPDQRENIESY